MQSDENKRPAKAFLESWGQLGSEGLKETLLMLKREPTLRAQFAEDLVRLINEGSLMSRIKAVTSIATLEPVLCFSNKDEVEGLLVAAFQEHFHEEKLDELLAFEASINKDYCSRTKQEEWFLSTLLMALLQFKSQHGVELTRRMLQIFRGTEFGDALQRQEDAFARSGGFPEIRLG